MTQTYYGVVNKDGYQWEPLTFMCDEGEEYGPSADHMAIYETRDEAENTARVIREKRGADVSVVRLDVEVVDDEQD